MYPPPQSSRWLRSHPIPQTRKLSFQKMNSLCSPGPSAWMRQGSGFSESQTCIYLHPCDSRKINKHRRGVLVFYSARQCLWAGACRSPQSLACAGPGGFSLVQVHTVRDVKASPPAPAVDRVHRSTTKPVPQSFQRRRGVKLCAVPAEKHPAVRPSRDGTCDSWLAPALTPVI